MQRRRNPLNSNRRDNFSSAPEQSGYRLLSTPQSNTTDEEDTTTEGVMLRSRDNFDRVASMARDAYRIGKEILGELNVEDKILVTFASGLQPNWGTNVALQTLNVIPQNVTEGGRTGDSVEMKGLHLNFHINRASAAYDVQWVRVFLVYFPMAKPTTFFNFPSGAAGGDGLWDFNLVGNPMAPFAQKDYDNRARAVVLWSKQYKVTHDDSEVNKSYWIKLHKHTQWEENSANGVDINTGYLQLGFVSSAAATANLQVQYLTRLYFVDN